LETKQLLLHGTLNILEKEKKVFAQRPSPFVSDSLNQTYLETHNLLKQSLANHLDPTEDVMRDHVEVNVIELPDFTTLRLSKGLLGRHHDDLNGKGLDDTTISLHCPMNFDSIFTSEEMLTGSQGHKRIIKCGVIDGKVAPNLLLYTRKIADKHAQSVCFRSDYLKSSDRCPLKKLVMRLLLTIKKPIDYQGFIYEREEIFSTFANMMAEKSDHVSLSLVSLIHFRTTASFDKMGY